MITYATKRLQVAENTWK